MNNTVINKINMKSLKQICNVNIPNSLHSLLEASLLDLDANLNITDADIIKDAITKFINDNYICKQFTISDEPNKDGKFEVSTKYNVEVKNKYITSLTNDLFVWDKVGGYFDCYGCKSLKSLKGAPKEVEGSFSCYECNSLKSLQGAPENVKFSFDCSGCKSLKSLKGAPKEVGCNFYCFKCTSLQSLEGAPKEIKGSFDCSYCDSLKYLEDVPKEFKGYFDCSYCHSLQSLKGAPKDVGGYFSCAKCNSLKSLEGCPNIVGNNFYCNDCKVKFEKSDVKAVCDVKREIYV